MDPTQEILENQILKNFFSSPLAMQKHERFETTLTQAAISGTVEDAEDARMALESVLDIALETNRMVLRHLFLASYLDRYRDSAGMRTTIRRIEEFYG